MKTIEPGQITLPCGITLRWDNSFTQTPMRGKQAWLDELRVSRQCHGRLEREAEGVVESCCLGVLCRVERLPRGFGPNGAEYAGSTGYYYGKSGVSATGQLPALFHFRHESEAVTVRALAHMNDEVNCGGKHLFSFADISVVIDLCFCEEVAK